jgi:AcrR family transcriptional regulator
MRLSRARIVAAAMDLIERDGPLPISMNGLALELGCSILSLYGFVPSRAALLDGVADAVAADLEPGPLPGASWEDQVRAQALALRRLARTRPRCTMVAVSWAAGGAARPRPVETAFVTLREAGFSDDDAARIARTLVAYAIGSPLTEGSAGDGSRRPRRRSPRCPAALEQHDPGADFEFGLGLVVRASADLLAAGASR